MRFAVVIAGVVADHVLDLAQFHDGHAGGIHDGFAILLLQLEPDGVRTRLGEAGQSSAVRAVLGGRVGHAHALGGDEINRVRFAVVIAGVVADHVLDLAQFHDGHAGGIHDGFAVLLLQLEPDGVRTRLGEAGQSSAVCTVLRGRIGRGHALGGNAQRNGVRLTVVVAGVVAGAVCNRLRGDCKHCISEYAAVVFLFNFEPDGIFAHLGEGGEFRAECAIVGCGVGNDCALGGDFQPDGVRLAIVGHLVADGGEINHRRNDCHLCGADDSFAILLLQPEPDGVFACVGEAGQRFCVSAVLGAGVGRAHARGGHAQINRVRLTVIHVVVFARRVLDLFENLLLKDGEVVVPNIHDVIAAVADDFYAVGARHTGRSIQRAIGIRVADLPR